MTMRTTTSWFRPKPRLIRMRSPSRSMRCGLACSPLTSTLPPSHARLASDRVLKRHATSSHTSNRADSLTSDQNFDLALGLEAVHEGVGLLLAVHALEILLEPRTYFLERHGARRLLLGHLDDVEPEVGLDEIADLARRQLERHIVEWTDHLTLLEEPEVAAVLRAARVL